MIKPDVYVKEDQSSLINDCGGFIYEVCTFIQYENIYNQANHKYFTSDKEILNIIRFYKITPYIEIQCYLYSAPLWWLIENDFTLYKKPEKKKRIIKK